MPKPRTSEEVLEELKTTLRHDIEMSVQLSGRPLADEIKRVEHHLAEIEAILADVKKK